MTKQNPQQEGGSPKPGPDPETLEIDRPWTEAVREALKKGRPPAPAKKQKHKGAGDKD